jgi:glucose-6-phosphate 1-epimerase
MSSTVHTITHSASGASCGIHEFGATIVSFKTGAGRECLFVSRDSKMDGSKPIRGGVPVVFPIFGPPAKDESSSVKNTMPQHGFTRKNVWKFDESSRYDTAEAAGIECSLQLKDVDDGRGDGNPWEKSNPQYDCTVVLAIKVEASQLTTTITVKNTGSKAFPFQALCHTYYMVDGHAALDHANCYVKGLEKYSVQDKVTGAAYVQGSDPVTIDDGCVDRVYAPTSLPIATQENVNVTIGVGNSKTLQMKAHGKVGGASVPVSCVVWNPNKGNAESMGDFGSDQYVDMICVEPGLLGDPILEAGKSADFVQIMTMMP